MPGRCTSLCESEQRERATEIPSGSSNRVKGFQPLSGVHSEKLDTAVLDGGHNQCSVEVIILLFTGGFCNQQAAVARGTVQEATLMKVVGLVL